MPEDAPDPAENPAPPEPAGLAQVVPDTVAWNYKVVPLGRQDGKLLLGTAQPALQANVETALRVCGEPELAFVTIPEAQFETLFASLYPASLFASPHVPPPPKAELMGLWDRMYLNFFARMGPVERLLSIVLGVLVALIFVLYGRVLLLGLIVIGRLLFTPLGVLVIGIVLLGWAWQRLVGRP